MDGVKGETSLSMMGKSMLRGFPLAVVLAGTCILAEKAYHKIYPPADHGHH